ncbi:hypothetical protein [Botrimarina sp.]|uniref:hypothetical protein n=1 Tax=Botrimarina sp. TaxID=2795802 RepID=UPI0032EBFA45
MAEEASGTNGTKNPTSTADVAVARWRTIRTLGICGCVAYCVYLITDAVKELFGQPVWVTVLVAVLGALTAALPQLLVWWKFRKFTKERLGRIAVLESEKDPQRSSSGLESDGGHQSDT